MNIENNDIVMKHCPHCESICLISKTDIDSSRAANKLVCISCHHCQKQFAIDGEQTKDRKIARPADLKIVICPSCKSQVTVPQQMPDPSTVDLFCPLCDVKIGFNEQELKDGSSHSVSVKSNLEKADLNPTRPAGPRPKSLTNYMPLYILAMVCLSASLYWAYETGQLPVDALPLDQWLKLLK